MNHRHPLKKGTNAVRPSHHQPTATRPAHTSLVHSLCGVGLLAAAGFFLWPLARPFGPAGGDNVSATPATPPGATAVSFDAAAARDHAWGRAGPHLAAAEQEAAQALDKHLASIPAFLTERRPGGRAFAEKLVSLRGKWQLVKAQVTSSGDQEYAAFLAAAFAEHLFRAEDLQAAVAAAVRGFLIELDGIEARLLVRLRADLSQDELPLADLIPALRSDVTFTNHYRTLAERLARDLSTDLAVVALREAFLWQASTIVTDLTIQVGVAVGARLGVSAGVLTAGAASAWTTFGVGLVVSIILDAALNEILKVAGYDAEEKVARRVSDMLGELGRTLTDGDPAARDALAQLQRLQTDDPDADVRAACQEAVRRIAANRCLLHGLRGELSTLSAARDRLRRESLRRLFSDNERMP
jgi:hypothetical protein